MNTTTPDYFQVLTNKKYLPNKKNGGRPPQLTDQRKKLIKVRNPNTMESLKRKATDWKIRATEEIKADPYGQFITFTFSPDGLQELTTAVHKDKPHLQGYDLDNAIALKAWQRFSDRHKNAFGRRPKHFWTTEIGGNGYESLHIHALIWEQHSNETFSQLWKYGFVHFSKYNQKASNGMYRLTTKAASYIVKYIFKVDHKHKHFKPIVKVTNHFGASYIHSQAAKQLHQFKGKDTNLMYRFNNGTKTRMPDYYYRRMFTEQQREQLYTHSLDEDTTYLQSSKFKNSDPEQVEQLLKASAYLIKQQTQSGYPLIINNDALLAEKHHRMLKHAAKIRRAATNKKAA